MFFRLRSRSPVAVVTLSVVALVGFAGCTPADSGLSPHQFRKLPESGRLAAQPGTFVDTPFKTPKGTIVDPVGLECAQHMGHKERTTTRLFKAEHEGTVLSWRRYTSVADAEQSHRFHIACAREIEQRLRGISVDVTAVDGVELVTMRQKERTDFTMRYRGVEATMHAPAASMPDAKSWVAAVRAHIDEAAR